jgi:hypothetical protein
MKAWISKQLDAMAIGLGFWFAIAMITEWFAKLPAWIFVLTYCASAFWLTGWVLIGLHRLYKWIRSKTWEIDND